MTLHPISITSACVVASRLLVAWGVDQTFAELDRRPIWDFVVVGAGTGGSLCAGRLAESGASVLLLEAGDWDQPWIYEASAPQRDRVENIWGYPISVPAGVHMSNSPDLRNKITSGKIPGGSSTVHQDIYNRPPLREFEHLGFREWSEERVGAAFKRIEADLQVSWFGSSGMDILPDPQYFVYAKILDGLHLPHRARPHQDEKGGGSSIGWWMYRSCPEGETWWGRKDGCKRHTSYWDMVAARNSTSSPEGALPIATLPNSLVKRVLLDDHRAVGVELFRHGLMHTVFARRAVVLAAGALGTPKILTLSGIGDPFELQRLGVRVQVANREVGQSLADHLAHFTWFNLDIPGTKFDESICKHREYFHHFFNLTEPYVGGDGMVDMEVRYFTGCNADQTVVNFGIENVLLHPESRGRVVVTSSNPEILPLAEFPSFWEKDFNRFIEWLKLLASILGCPPDALSADHRMGLEESVRKHIYLYQHLCCSARAALDGEPGVCDEHLRVRGVSGLYVSDASALPTLTSSHTSAGALLVAELASSHMLKHTKSRALPNYAEDSERTALEALFASRATVHKNLTLPTVQLPLRRSQAEATPLELPLVGLGTGSIRENRVVGAVATFLRLGGRHLDTAAMYENYAEIRNGIVASGLADLSELVVTSKVMPLGRDEVRKSIAEALEGLNVRHIDIALLHWPGDISSGRLMHGKPLPACAEVLQSGTSWKRCRRESYEALLAERDAGRVRSVGVSNFAIRHLNELSEDTASLQKLDLPAIHQMELNPFWHDDQLLHRHELDKTRVMAFGCLGGAANGAPMLKEVGFKKIAARFNVTPAQILYRWAIQRGVAVIAGGSSDEHIAQNFKLFDFELTEEDMDFIGSVPPSAMKKSYRPLPEEIL